MARLSRITRASVEQAIEVFRTPEGAALREELGFERSKLYFLRVGAELFDTKPVIAVAYGFAVPGEGALRPKQLSGGQDHSARRLRELGFDVVSPALLQPPRLGDEHESRTAIAAKYGGTRVSGIITFPGETIVNVFSDAEGPYSDDPPTLTAPFGYRGEGLIGPQKVDLRGNRLLENARLDRTPVRFWYRPIGGQFSFVSWVAVLGRAWVPGKGADGRERPEIEWQLEAVASTSSEDWPSEVLLAMDESALAPADKDPGVPEAEPLPTYRELLGRVESKGQPRRSSGVVKSDFARSAAARRAVLIRASGQCESPRCTGMPGELNRRGEPILDVDHIKDLALGGEDHPTNMVAICPNCHAAKTRGNSQARWRRELAAVAAEAHSRSLAAEGAAEPPAGPRSRRFT